MKWIVNLYQITNLIAIGYLIGFVIGRWEELDIYTILCTLGAGGFLLGMTVWEYIQEKRMAQTREDEFKNLSTFMNILNLELRIKNVGKKWNVTFFYVQDEKVRRMVGCGSGRSLRDALEKAENDYYHRTG